MERQRRRRHKRRERSSAQSHKQRRKRERSEQGGKRESGLSLKGQFWVLTVGLLVLATVGLGWLVSLGLASSNGDRGVIDANITGIPDIFFRPAYDPVKPVASPQPFGNAKNDQPAP